MQKRRILIIVLAVSILVVWRLLHRPNEAPLQHLTGRTMGPIKYSIKYIDKTNYQEEVDQLLNEFNESLSTYIPYSEVSELNQQYHVTFRSGYMYPVLERSLTAYTNSDGAFDPSVGPLVNAWGFGKNKEQRIDSTKIDSLLEYVGFHRVQFDQTTARIPQGYYLDFSASAKGYAVDLVAQFLIDHGVTDYMVEIGGEVSCLGKNKDNKVWKIGINEPSISADEQALFATTFLKDMAMATSGNYRNYHLENGKLVAHTINPKTGYSEVKQLLSASVFAPNCTLADAYATACMVKGVQGSIDMIEKLDEVECFLIYTDDQGLFTTYASPGIAKQIEVLD